MEGIYMQNRLRETQKIPVKSRSAEEKRRKERKKIKQNLTAEKMLHKIIKKNYEPQSIV
jgi:hypothetical protein